MAIGAAIPTAGIILKPAIKRARRYHDIHKITKEQHAAKVNAERHQAIADENRAKLT